MHKLARSLGVALNFCMAVCVYANEVAVFEESFEGSSLGPHWKISGDKSGVSVQDGAVTLRAAVDAAHNLTQIVQTSPQFYFLGNEGKPLRITADLHVSPEAKSSVGRIMISSKPGQARNDDAFAVLVNGLGEYRILRIVDGVTLNQKSAWKKTGGEVVKAEIELDPTHYTVRLWRKDNAEPIEETGAHEIPQNAWGEPDKTSLALGAWTVSQANASETTVTFDNVSLHLN